MMSDFETQPEGSLVVNGFGMVPVYTCVSINDETYRIVEAQQTSTTGWKLLVVPNKKEGEDNGGT